MLFQIKPMTNPAMVKHTQPIPNEWSGTIVAKIVSICPSENSAV